MTNNAFNGTVSLKCDQSLNRPLAPVSYLRISGQLRAYANMFISKVKVFIVICS